MIAVHGCLDENLHLFICKTATYAVGTSSGLTQSGEFKLEGGLGNRGELCKRLFKQTSLGILKVA